MDIFSYDDTRRDQYSFYISTVMIAFVTWAVSAAVLWLVHDDTRLSRLKQLLNDFQWKATRPLRTREYKKQEPELIFQGV